MRGKSTATPKGSQKKALTPFVEIAQTTEEHNNCRHFMLLSVPEGPVVT